ncbi:MAG: hypothetical protein Q9218_002258 [Villophora microphyllina]
MSTTSLDLQAIGQQTPCSSPKASAQQDSSPSSDVTTSSAEGKPSTYPNALLLPELGSGQKRKRSVVYGRGLHTRQYLPMPTYNVKQSFKIPGQQKGLAWQSAAGKMALDREYSSLMLKWGGVKPTHQGTCVVCPSDWRFLSPSNLLDITDPHRLPVEESSRMNYAYSDFAVPLRRAIAWFRSDLEKNGALFDQFLGDGPWAPMDASHRCHHDHCLVHIVYEASNINQDRKGCAEEAKIIRREGKELPAFCSYHDPPCLLQHAALTSVEVYLLQFHVLSQATGLQFRLSSQRPQYHPYPTYESRLPLTWKMDKSVVGVREEDLLAILPEPPGASVNICKYCRRLKTYGRVCNYWAHIYHQHTDVSVLDRLDEIRRSGASWTTYWRDHGPDGGGNREATMAKLATAASPSFCWEDVIEWDLPA